MRDFPRDFAVFGLHFARFFEEFAQFNEKKCAQIADFSLNLEAAFNNSTGEFSTSLHRFN